MTSLFMRESSVEVLVARCGLFVAEGDHGVDLHGAAGGDEAGESGYGCESECDGGQGNGIVRGDAEKHVTDQVRSG